MVKFPKQYWRIIRNGDRYEYHTGLDEQEVREGESLNAYIMVSSTNADQILCSWIEQAEGYNLIHTY